MKKILSLPIATLLLLAGCQKPENTDPKPDTPAQEDALKLDKTSITAEADGATATIQVTANCDWTVTNALDWVSVTPASGKSNGSISVTVSANAGIPPIIVQDVDIESQEIYRFDLPKRRPKEEDET